MIKTLKTLKYNLFLLLFLCSGLIAVEQSQEVHKVERVIDGDTIVVDKDERVRYIGINTPEMRPVEPYAKEATAANKKLVDGKQVILKYDVQKYDRYQRTLAYVYVKVDTVMVFVN